MKPENGAAKIKYPSFSILKIIVSVLKMKPMRWLLNWYGIMFKRDTWQWEDNVVWGIVDHDLSFYDEEDWCKENCPGEWEYSEESYGVEAHTQTFGGFTFKDEETAMAFWLTFNEFRS